jgi:histidinol-phosphate aminotransferase
MPPKIDPHIANLPTTIPFVAPERTQRETGKVFTARIGANEGNFGCSPLAIDAVARVARDHIHNYCDPECYMLREAICARLSVEMANVVVGSGIDNILGMIVRVFSCTGDPILTSLGAYPTFNYHVAGYDRALHSVPYQNDHDDLATLSETARALNPAIVYLSNPDNPMGTFWHDIDIVKFMDSLPESTLLVLDEAYGETAPRGILPPLELDRPNVLRLRTFSKAYGLAGLRCGYALGHKSLVTQFEKVRDHFGVNIMAQHAATASMNDDQWLKQNLTKIAAARTRIANIAVAHKLQPIVSATNFVTIDCGRDESFAMSILEGLMDRGIFVRKPMAPVLDRCIRVSAGRPDELDAFETALSQTLDTLQPGAKL